MDLYPHLLHAGALPTPQEHASILAAKLTCEDQRTKLVHEIRELQKRLEDAQKRLELLDEQIDAHSRLISPLRRIPPEIMRDIFALATPSPLAIEPVTDRIFHAPWTTMEVCRHWNEVCLTFGSLWSDISITATPFRERPIPALPGGVGNYSRGNDEARFAAIARSAQILTTQLERSKDANLYVTIAMSSDNYGQPHLRILWPHIHRVAYLKAPAHVLDNTPMSFPFHRIREVHVDYFRSSPEEHEHDRIMQNITGHSGVTKFSAAIYNTYDGMAGQRLPAGIYRPRALAKLFVYASHSFKLAQLRPLLPQLQNLTHLQLTLEGGAPDTSSPNQDRIPLIKLSTLSIDCSRTAFSQPVTDILTHIVAPNLQHLSLPVPRRRDTVEQFLVASGCKLQTLRVQSTSSTGPIYMRGLLSSRADAFRGIHTLELSHKCEEEEAHRENDESELCMNEVDAVRLVELLDMTVSDDGAPQVTSKLRVFPQLQILQLRNMKLPAREFIDMLQNRRRTERGKVRLASCSIASVYSVHRLLGAEELGKQAAKVAREQVIWLDRQIAQQSPVHPVSEDWRGRGLCRKPGVGDSLRNRQLTWAEGLEREAEQKGRLEELVEGGLELWM